MQLVDHRQRRDHAIGRVHVGRQHPDATRRPTADLAISALDVQPRLQLVAAAHKPRRLVEQDRRLIP
jgi:hypothetical protein